MRCLECGWEAVTERPERPAQGYRRFRCRHCGKQFNERSDTLLNRTQYPSDVIALVVLWRVRYKLSLRDLPEMFAVRGIVLSYEGPCCTDQGWGRNDPDPVLGSGDADGLRASQLQHAVQDMDRYVHLGGPTLVRTRAQPVPDHPLPPADGGLGAGTPVISGRLLPAHPAPLGDELE